ncbi:FtsK/SpoIIIE domain-containing protein [Leucobacter komagatae]|uniref:Cell division protein FtsK n=1 Tax=Leucobacter komagatae TaxID=55969 RepID=A0A0D0IMD7_9MICO|nr:FtsK/SpoIIIE domain-containing protein [Leucobacter komagatae]KIP52759.1 cell division protein FtsK [Leucobacter komagatae]
MKLKLALALPSGALHDVTISCNVTTTVRDTAAALIRTGLYRDSNIEAFHALRHGHVTIIGSPDGTSEYLLDPVAPLGQSGLQSGWQIRVAGEFDRNLPRTIPAVGVVEVIGGDEDGVRFSLIPGDNSIGRDPRSRILLSSRSVSRRHAVIEAGDRMILSNLGSANGIEVRGHRVESLPIDHAVEVLLGSVRIRITPARPANHPGDDALDHRRPHTRAPRVDPHFEPSTRELPAPPKQAAGSRIPMLAMLAPMLMGGALYAITRSPMSLMMVAFSPMMMIGSWLDGRLTARRRRRGEDRIFTETLAAEREQLAALRDEEIATRATETPRLDDIAAAMRDQGRLLWARRPEHRSFLELRFGEGELPSRTAVVMPKRGEAAGAQWEAIEEIEREFSRVAPVPVTERLDQCGSIGLAGPQPGAHALARALLVQLTGLHSPAELTVAAFTGETRSPGEWEWLKWLPHVDPVGGPTPAWQLADDERASLALLIALEGVIGQRQQVAAKPGGGASLRSHLPQHSGEDAATEAVTVLPLTPVIVVLVLDGGVEQAHRARLIALAEDGPDLGVHMVWVADRVERVPAACRTFVEVGAPDDTSPATVNFVRQRDRVPLTRMEQLDAETAAMLARAVAPVDDTAARALDESDLPRAVNLREVHGVDLLGGGSPLLQNWERSGSLVRDWRAGEERAPVSLAAVVGQGAEGPAILDLRTHGPHALVGGTTGAGKSEFLQSWIMSLAANVSPDRLTYLLVDYKGGAAFAECVDLPHTVGLVTDLSPYLVRRALTSLRAELRRREELLAEHGAKDLITMEQRSDPAAPPVLVIVIDEFAALASDVPEFVDGVIDVAQRGRSLGLHLVMATQRPAGVVTDNLRANTNLRIALRMADEADSGDVLGVPDAALFDAETPGRGAMKVGPGRVEHFQTGYLGGRASAAPRLPRLEVRSLGLVEGEPWSIPGEPQSGGPRPVARAARDIERLRDALVGAATAGGIAVPRKPWLPTLPALLPLDAVLPRPAHAEVGATGIAQPGGLPVGLIDLPETQAQEPVRIDLDVMGNLAIFGASGTGKTTSLLTIAAAASAAANADGVHIYGIDAAGGNLDPLAPLPTVGAVAQLGDGELTQRVIRHVWEVVNDRSARFAAARANSLAAYRATGGERAAGEARVVLLIDGFSALTEAIEGFGERGVAATQLAEIMRAGRAVGVHVVLTAERSAALSSALAASVQERLVLRLASPNDYSYLDVRAEVLESAGPGRGVFAGQQNEIQLAFAGETPALADQAAALERLAERLGSGDLVAAPRIRNAPDRIALADLPAEDEGLPVFGIDTRTLRAVGMPHAGLGVIAGPPGAGLSTATRSCAIAVERWAAARGEQVDRVLLSFDSGSGTHADPLDWEHVARGAAAVGELARRLVIALGGRPHQASPAFTGLLGGGVAPDPVPVGATQAVPEAPLEFPLPGRRGVIVVERPGDAEESDALPQLIALAKAARRASVLVLFEFELGGGGSWDLLAALKQPNWGLALQPDENEPQTPFRETFGRVSRAAFPPGRGFAVVRGTATPVHVALPVRGAGARRNGR